MIAQEYEKEGVKVKLSGVKAWVCAKCGEIYFEPGAAQKGGRCDQVPIRISLHRKTAQRHIESSVVVTLEQPSAL